MHGIRLQREAELCLSAVIRSHFQHITCSSKLALTHISPTYRYGPLEILLAAVPGGSAIQQEVMPVANKP